MMTYRTKLFSALFTVSLLAACGDGGPSESQMKKAILEAQERSHKAQVDQMRRNWPTMMLGPLTEDNPAYPQPPQRAEKIEKAGCYKVEGKSGHGCDYYVTLEGESEPIKGRSRFVRSGGSWEVVE